ncbi:hypothetical protein PV08_01928 [Exophiala spinifera]|uniref:Ubiquitin-like domain-containing protein n=1 Tax=Exophiala spinifera TaxID=91928 RepID=A0A0D2BQS0_9EURO|nr:uncharacterized protein PV08_01928 [Exophiala spinifera]KIW21348.1 hypothetical protein PV08_01928 [Exophiala spinifera]
MALESPGKSKAISLDWRRKLPRSLQMQNASLKNFERQCRVTEPDLLSVYFRLTLGSDLGPIALDEWRLLPVIAQRTRSWLQKNIRQVIACTDQLKIISNSKENDSQHQRRQSPATGTTSSLGSTVSDPSQLSPLPGLRAELISLDERWPCEILITDPSDGNELRISFWRTVRIPEDGKVYDLPAGLGRFPLVGALAFRDLLVEEDDEKIDVLLPMYDREAMYVEFSAGRYEHSLDFSQRPFAVRPYVGRINAISSSPMQSASTHGYPGGDMKPRTRVGVEYTNEVITAPPDYRQDYIVTEASIHDIRVHAQWLDGVAYQPGRVKQFVSVPFGSGASIEAQKSGEEKYGGIQLEIIPTFPLDRLRKLTGKTICLSMLNITGKTVEIMIDGGALVYDLLQMIDARVGAGGASLGFWRLIFRGIGLEPLGRLADYGISNNCTIHMVPKLRGGGSGPAIAAPKRMSLGAGGSVSQNISADHYQPSVWDASRRKLINIQIINSNDFEKLTGVKSPPTPIGFETYESLGLPFFHYYLEDATAVSGDFSGVMSIEALAGQSAASFTSALEDGASNRSGYDWVTSPKECANCRDDVPQKM